MARGSERTRRHRMGHAGGALAAAATVAILAIAAVVHADGGTVRIRAVTDGLVVTVFTAPEPLRAGPVDVSVLVQRDDGTVVLDAGVAVTATPLTGPEGIAPVVRPATHADATTKLLYAAPLVLAAGGDWRLDVVVTTPEGSTARVEASVPVGPPTPPLRAIWPWVALPPAAIALFAVHQRLRRRETAHARAILAAAHSTAAPARRG